MMGPVQHTEPALPEDYAWAVWTLTVRDPDSRAAPGVAERTREAVAEMCAALGCLLDRCHDDDAVNNVPYYQWAIRVPAAEHRGRSQGQPPGPIERVCEHLRSCLPERVDDWSVEFDEAATLDLYCAQAVREDYEDLLVPLEVALLGMRRDGAAALEPTLQRWAVADTVFVYTYVMHLAREDPLDEHSGWLYLQAGTVVEPGFWSSPAGIRFLRYDGHRPGAPVLLLPRDELAQTWLATITTSAYAADGHRAWNRASNGARHEWTGIEPVDLAERLAIDIPALFPHLRAVKED
jgi:hypothetical protein